MEDTDSGSEDDDKLIVVIDIGTTLCRAGFAGVECPRAVFPTFVGHPKSRGEPEQPNTKQDCYVGDAFLPHYGLLDIKYPVERGIIQNWEDMEKIYDYIFKDKLNVYPDEHPVLISERPFNPKANQERLTQIMFEIFQVPVLCLAYEAELVLQDSGRTTGVVLDSGGGVTHSIPVHDGNSLRHAAQGMNYAGSDVTQTFIDQLQERGLDGFTSSFGRRLANDIKEHACYVAVDYEKELKKYKPFYYDTVDCQKIMIENERFRAPEILLRTDQTDKQGVHELVYNSIMKCSPDIQKDMWANIVLAGGNTMFPGFTERLRKELEILAPPDTEINVIEHPWREYYTWKGGSTTASQSDFSSKCISKEVYEEYGPSIIHKKAS